MSVYLFCNSSFRDKLKSIILLSSIFIIDSGKTSLNGKDGEQTKSVGE